MEGYVARASELGMAREALAAALRDMMTAAGEPGEEGTDDDATRVPGSSSCAVSETEAEAVMEAFLTAYDRELSQVARQTRLDTAALEGTASCVNNFYDEWVIDADNASICVGSQRWEGKRVRIFVQEGQGASERHGPGVPGSSLSTRMAAAARTGQTSTRATRGGRREGGPMADPPRRSRKSARRSGPQQEDKER